MITNKKPDKLQQTNTAKANLKFKFIEIFKKTNLTICRLQVDKKRLRTVLVENK